MKFTKSIILALTLLFGVSAVNAQVSYTQFATVGTALGATSSWAVVGNNVDIPGGGTAIVTYLNATAAGADTNAAYIQFYDCTNKTIATAATVNTRTNTVQSTNGLAAGDIVVIKHVATDTYERIILTTTITTNRIVFAADPVSPLAAGDIIYEQRARGKIPFVNTTTLNLSGDGIYSGQKNHPLFLEAVGTVTPVLNAVNAKFR